MFRAAVSCCLIFIAFGVSAANGQPAACSSPEILFNSDPPAPGTVPPRPRQLPLAPQYSAAKNSQGQSGLVWANFIVERDGRKCDVKVNSVDGPHEFAEVVAAWLAASNFSPGLKGGKPIVSEVKRMYNFSAPLKRR